MQTQRIRKQVVQSRYEPGKNQEDLVQIDIDGKTLWVTLEQQNEVLEALREANVPHAIHPPLKSEWVAPVARWAVLGGIVLAIAASVLPVALEASARWFNRVGLAAHEFTSALLLFLGGVALPVALSIAVLACIYWWASAPGEPDVDYQKPASPPVPSQSAGNTIINNVTNNFINNPQND